MALRLSVEPFCSTNPHNIGVGMRMVSIEAEAGTVEIEVGTVEADVDPEEVLDELDEKELKEYIEKRFSNRVSIEQEVTYDGITDLAHQYWHGDLDLKRLIEIIGKDEIRKLL